MQHKDETKDLGFEKTLMKNFAHICAYQFIALEELAALQTELFSLCQNLNLKGTILLSHEGINISLAGSEFEINDFKMIFKLFPHFSNIIFHETFCDQPPYQKLKVKIKKEIITFRQATLRLSEERAPAISPATFKTWLDNKKDMLVLDTRNQFEVEWGTFHGAKHLQLQQFDEFPHKLTNLPTDQPIVLFCTGGIRCEKAALCMLEAGFREVYQLDGGILGYFAQVGEAHYEGQCFVFDNRIALTPDLTPVA